MNVYLEKIDPGRNCCRFYLLRIEADLFAGHQLIAQWGRIGSQGRSTIKGSGSMDACRDLQTRIARLRQRRGYALT